MNQEANRLQSFDQWSSETVIDPRVIAKAGFYYTGQGQEVQCFRCGGKISEWNLGDDIMLRHRQLDPQCPFFLNLLCSGNIPLPDNDPSEMQPTDLSRNSYSYIDDIDMNLDEIYKNDAMRLLSFVNWPLSFISRESLAVAGFYYMGGKPGVPIDKVRCAWCGGELENWLRGDKPIIEHNRHFPNCTYAKEKLEAINQSESANQGLSNESLLRDNMTELGIQSHEAINRSNYCTLELRLRSFEGWPPNHPQQPRILAAAGFYYAGITDEVRCFYCDGGLCNWTANDDPWIEHAKYHPRCDFINLIKGREFVDRYRTNRSGQPWVVRDEDIEQYMNSEFAAAALQCGIQPGRLRRAIRVRLEKTGTPFLTTEALIDAALNEQLNETPFPTVVLSASPPPYMEEDEAAGPSSSNSGRQVQVDDAAIEQVTRMIIDSALSGTETFPVPPNSSLMTSTENIVPENASQSVNVTQTEIEATENTMKKSDSGKIDLSLEEENRLLKEARTCKVCMDSEVGIVFLPCGHLVTCVECAICLAQCPLCRSNIKGVVKTYLS